MLLLAIASSQAQQPKAAPSELGSKQAPAAIELTRIPGVEITRTPVIRVEATDKTVGPSGHWTPEWVAAYCTAFLALTTFGLAFYTGLLYRATVRLGREAKTREEGQIARMERSITEANRTANATQEISTATTNNSQLMQGLLRKQMRAYVSVEVGGATYQDARLRFGASPRMINNGLTPARNVSYKVLTGIKDGTRPLADIGFEPIGDLIVNDANLAPRQLFQLNGVVDQRLPDEEVEAVMQGATRRLFAWGKVTYDDVYDGSWETNFCFNYTFWKNAKGEIQVSGFYFQHGNRAT
jgi:hypothetical protein